MISHQLSDGILSITINRPNAKNAINLSMYSALADSVELAQQQDVKVVILFGCNDIFCSGNDIHDFLTISQGDAALQEQSRKEIERFMHAMINCPVPIIASVSGPAIGIGMTMLQHCDVVCAHPKSIFQVPFVPLGLCPEFGSSILLEKFIGKRKATAMLLLGEVMTTEEAFNSGFINQITTTPDEIASSYANKVAQLPALAMRYSKQLLNYPDKERLSECITQENDHVFRLLTQPEAVEAIKRFLKKS